MRIVYYPAIIERARRGYGVFFPDLPGCTSAGETVKTQTVTVYIYPLAAGRQAAGSSR